MTEVSRIGLRKAWFQVHKWIGLLLAILIIPLSLSGAALVWHDWLDETINPQRYAVSASGPLLAPSAYVAGARKALDGGDLISMLRYPEHGGPVVVTAVKAERSGPPARMNVWIDPATGRVLDAAGANEGLVRFLHGLHGNLLFPGVGRQIVGWLGVAMLVSSLSGLWLWWPAMGQWTRGLRWKRARDFNTNLHHQMGFWICVPLAMLSFTGIWISFPPFFAALAGPSGEQQRVGNERAQRMRARPIEAPRLTPEAALAIAGGGRPVSIGWPTDKAPAWSVSLAGAGEVEIDDATGARAESRRGEGGGGSQSTARLMRRLHDGTGMGPVWQTIIFIGGILPAGLAVTGIIMWWRARGWRGEVARRGQTREAVEGA